jgi:hypothetical protein
MTGFNSFNSHSSNCGSSCSVATSHAHRVIIMDTACFAVSILLISLLSLRLLG